MRDAQRPSPPPSTLGGACLVSVQRSCNEQSRPLDGQGSQGGTGGVREKDAAVSAHSRRSLRFQRERMERSCAFCATRPN